MSASIDPRRSRAASSGSARYHGYRASGDDAHPVRPDTDGDEVEPEFDLVRRGFDPTQVEDHLADLLARRTIAQTAAAERQAEMERLREEADSLRSALTTAQQAADQTTAAGLGARIEGIVKLAEQEALTANAAAQAARDQSREQAEQEAAAIRSEADEERRKQYEQAVAIAEKTVAQAQEAAAQIQSEAEALTQDLLDQARVRAAQLLMDAEARLAERLTQSDREMAARRETAQRRLAEIMEKAERLRQDSQQIRDEAEQSAQHVLDAARAEMEKAAAARAEADSARTAALEHAERLAADARSELLGLHQQVAAAHATRDAAEAEREAAERRIAEARASLELLTRLTTPDPRQTDPTENAISPPPLKLVPGAAPDSEATTKISDESHRTPKRA